MPETPSFPRVFEPYRAIARKLGFLTEPLAKRDGPVPRGIPAVQDREPALQTEFVSIAIVNSKGGTGKSTTGINLLVAAHRAGERAALIDCDLAQHTAIDWWSLRGANPKVIQVEPAKVAQAIASAKRHHFTFVLVDTPGQDTLAATAAVSSVDLVLVPTPAAWADYQATARLLARLRAAQTPAVVLLTRVHKSRATRNQKFRAALVRRADVLTSVVPNLEIFSDAAGLGATPFDFNEVTARQAAADVDAVYREVRAYAEKRRHG